MVTESQITESMDELIQKSRCICFLLSSKATTTICYSSRSLSNHEKTLSRSEVK